MNRAALLKKRGLMLGLGLFFIVEVAAVVINSLLQRSFRVDWSISTYVGLQAWSAVVFAGCNCVVAGLYGTYLWKLGEKWEMPRLYYYTCFLLLLGLIGLSFCPLGYFDVGTEVSLISMLHQMNSRMMFMMMLMVATMLAGRSGNSARSQVGLASFILFAFVCLAGYMMGGEWFSSFFMVYETLYLVWFVAALLIAE